MQPEPETREMDSSQRVIAALTNLADLSLRTSTLRFSPPGTLDHFATTFISRLVTLCEAQQGALFLVRPADSHPATQARQPFADQPHVSVVARARMSAEEARTALAASMFTAAPPEWSLDFSDSLPILAWKRSLDVLFAKTPSPDDAASHFGSHSYLLLLFAWPATDHQAQKGHTKEQSQARQLLPFLTNLVDTILLHLLTAPQKGEQPEEALPTELLATVGHEFKGPLTTIQGYATTLLHHEHQLPLEERQEFLKAIGEASAHLGKLVDRFLELAQFETHAYLFVPVAVDLAALAQEAITAAKKSGFHILLLTSPQTKTVPPAKTGEQVEDITASNEQTVSGDRRLLRMMLDLLLENALAYSPQGSLIQVSIHPSNPAHILTAANTSSDPDNHVALILPAAFQENEPLVEIQVQDHGIGIEPVHLSNIFRRFYRVDTSLTREVNGLGLGLALCKSIVAQHRGMLWVESAVGVGSTFHIMLPCRVTLTTGEMI